MSFLLKDINSKNEEKAWVSPGVAEKPSGCFACKYLNTGAGFCGDDNPSGKRIAILCPTPTKGEILERMPWSGPQGWIYQQMYLKPAGLKREEVFIGHVLRCRPPFRRLGDGDSYPTGAVRRSAELTCRQYDQSHTYRGDLLPGGIEDYKPDTFLCTFEPQKGLEVTAYKWLISEDIKKAVRLTERGRRVMILMGTGPFELLGGGLVDEGGVKTWRGHYWSGSWPFKAVEPPKVPAFKQPSGRRRWRK